MSDDEPSVHLVAKSPSDRAAWFEAALASYAEDLARAGYTPEEIALHIERGEATLSGEGGSIEGQLVFDVMSDAEIVGSLWLTRRNDAAPGEWYVNDIVVAEEFRGRGYGRATMEAAETYVRAQGATMLALNVFGFNTVARELYESMGYVALAIGMRKNLA